MMRRTVRRAPGEDSKPRGHTVLNCSEVSENQWRGGPFPNTHGPSADTAVRARLRSFPRGQEPRHRAGDAGSRPHRSPLWGLSGPSLVSCFFQKGAHVRPGGHLEKWPSGGPHPEG